MTPGQIDLVQSSFSKIAPIAEPVSAIFYDRLFETTPEVRHLFKNDISDQGRKLIATLAFIVSGLRNLDSILPAVRALAIKHVEFGVSAEHYAPVGAALIWTLEQGLGAAFDQPTRAAWLTAYNTLSGVMINAAYGEAPA